MLRSLLLVAGARLLIGCGWCEANHTSEVMCPSFVNPSLEVECQLNDQNVDCDQPMVPGTKALVQCSEFYSSHMSESDEFETTCNPDGTWSRRVYSCTPKCGEPSRYNLIPGYHYWWYLTYKTLTVEVPWHAGIYYANDGKFLQVCGGTIISERVIITAASCFWNASSMNSNSENEHRIAVGKLYHDWYKVEENAQLPAIDRVILHKLFRGPVFNWAYDIALIKLKSPLRMTRAVRPVCVDFERIYANSFLPGTLGVVVGWGSTGWDFRSEKLRKRTLPYVANDVCERYVPSSFVSYLTIDKFCAGYLNGTGVCAGDGGGGFATEFTDGKWYLMGIVSVGVPSMNADVCDIYHYATYTRVSLFYDFIRKHLNLESPL